MAGDSGAHADIFASLLAALVVQLVGRPCRARAKDTKVRSGPVPGMHLSMSGMYSYPDVVAICGEPVYHDEHEDVVTNPTAVVEVLSPSTEQFDRTERFRRYQTWNPTLRDYILVAQDLPRAQCFSKDNAERWIESAFEGLEAVAPIRSIDCRLTLREMYDRVKFPV